MLDYACDLFELDFLKVTFFEILALRNYYVEHNIWRNAWILSFGQCPVMMATIWANFISQKGAFL